MRSTTVQFTPYRHVHVEKYALMTLYPPASNVIADFELTSFGVYILYVTCTRRLKLAVKNTVWRKSWIESVVYLMLETRHHRSFQNAAYIEYVVMTMLRRYTLSNASAQYNIHPRCVAETTCSSPTAECLSFGQRVFHESIVKRAAGLCTAIAFPRS
jgi:hypothetical protein